MNSTAPPAVARQSATPPILGTTDLVHMCYPVMVWNCFSYIVSSSKDTIPVSSSTDWQAAFGFGSSSKQQDDDLGFDPFDVTRKALADLIEKELSVQDPCTTSPGPLSQASNHGPGLSSATSHHFPSGLPRLPQIHHRPIYSSFSFPGSQNSQGGQQQQQPPANRHPWMAVPTRNHLAHLNHSASAASHSNFLDLNLPPQHNTGLGGIPISGTGHRTLLFYISSWCRASV